MNTPEFLKALLFYVFLVISALGSTHATTFGDTTKTTIIVVSVCERPYLDFGKYKVKLRSDTTITVKNLSLFTSALSFPKPGKGYIKFIVKGKKEVLTIYNTEQAKQLVQEHSMLNSTTVMAVRNAECYLSLTNPERKVLTVDQLASYLSCNGQYFNWDTDTICLFSSELLLDSAKWVIRDEGSSHIIPIATNGNCMYLRSVSELNNFHDISLNLFPSQMDEIVISDISFQDVRVQISAMLAAGFDTDEIVNELTVRCRQDDLSEDFLKLLRHKVAINIKNRIENE